MTINILGTEYTVTVKKYDDDECFKESNADGYCLAETHEIVICDLSTFPEWEKESERVREVAQKKTLCHEIIHAFLNESGLQDNAGQFNVAWSKNEEMVDWFAIQGPKIYAAWQEVGVL